VAAVFLAFTALFKDSLFRIVGSGNSSKRLAFEVDGITAGTTRTWTALDADIVVAGSASALTSGRVPFSTTGGLLIDSANLTWTGSLLTLATTGSGNGTIKVYTNAARNALVGRFNDSNSMGGFYVASSGEVFFGGNVDITGGNETYSRGTIAPCKFGNPQGTTAISWEVDVAAAGTAGNTISWTRALCVTTGAALLVNTTTDDAVHKLQVSGRIRTTGDAHATATTATAGGTTTLTATSSQIQQFTGTLGQTINLPAANAAGSGFAQYFCIINLSTAAVTPTRAGSDTFVGGGTTSSVAAGVTQWFASDGISVWRLV
jgi:hypothetical protein